MGKAGVSFMRDAIFPNLGSRSPRVLVGPGRGLDNAVVALRGRDVMIATVDPISMVPSLGPELSAWLSVHLIASDYFASGTSPTFATFSYNFPRAMAGSERGGYLRAVGRECGKLGVSIIGGHTGSYPGAAFTVVGAGSMLGFARRGGFVTPAMARAGDAVLMTKHAAIEGAATLALSFPERARERVGKGLAVKAERMIRLCSTVRDSVVAAREGLGEGAVTSMHDATEGGVIGGLEEMAAASKKAFVVEEEAIPVSPAAKAVCAEFGLDPLRTLGEGALLITCSPDSVGGLKARMARARIAVAELGAVRAGRGLLLRRKGGGESLEGPVDDRYWEAYARASKGRN